MKILLAEDDPSIQSIASLALTKVGGHTVVQANDGIATLELAQKERPDLILLDVMMPNMSGFETCEKLKDNPETKNIPVIFLSARAQAHEIQHGMSIGAKGYILKPFDPMSLHSEIEKVLKNDD